MDWTHASTLASMLLISTLMSFAKTSTNKGETDARSLCRERGAFQEAQGLIRNDRDIIQQVGWPGPCPFYASAGHPAPGVGEYSREGRQWLPLCAFISGSCAESPGSQAWRLKYWSIPINKQCFYFWNPDCQDGKQCYGQKTHSLCPSLALCNHSERLEPLLHSPLPSATSEKWGEYSGNKRTPGNAFRALNSQVRAPSTGKCRCLEGS